MVAESSRRREKFDGPAGEAVDPKVLDLAHLARYTIGNRELEEELLRLFRAQLRAQITAIADCRDADQWRFATHTLKGVARSIGAWGIADTAERLEQLGFAGERGAYGRLMVTLAAQIATCEREIERVIRHSPSS